MNECPYYQPEYCEARDCCECELKEVIENVHETKI